MDERVIEFGRLLREEKIRHPDKLKHIIGLMALEHLAEDHIYRFLVRVTNLQFANVGLGGTRGKTLDAPLYFAIVEGTGTVGNAHTFPVGRYRAVLFERVLVDSMWNLSEQFVYRNRDLVSLQWAPKTNLNVVMQLLLLMQASIVNSHEFTHVASEHGSSGQDADKVRFRAEELEADLWGLFLCLTSYFSLEGRNAVSAFLGLGGKALENSAIESFLTAIMLVLCSRWSRNLEVESIPAVNYPPPALRLRYAMRIMEMWCREVGSVPTTFLIDGTVPRLFGRVISLFPDRMKESWKGEVEWLESPASREYRQELEDEFQRLRASTK
ncbi:MAG: hypothetical protein ABI955_12030 [Nitrospirota bacterium]